MKKIFVSLSFLFTLSIAFSQDPEWAAKTGAKNFPAGIKTFSVNNYGAVSDGKTLNSRAIQKAIDDCSKKGGGIVTFKPGTYVQGCPLKNFLWR